MSRQLKNYTPELQTRIWPPVSSFSEYDHSFSHFLHSSVSDQKAKLRELQAISWDELGDFINKALGEVYAYVYGYHDSPCCLKTNTELEIALQQAKIVLEDAYLEQWLPIEPLPKFENVEQAYDYLQNYIQGNLGVQHELFNYLENEAPLSAIREFLRLEVCRNEVVDDEVAFLVVGLQGNLKRMASANLWDECGNGELENFHTYWLRRLLEYTKDWDGLINYRKTTKPWFSLISSNVFNILLTRPGHKYKAYGCFTTTEAWVEPHFEKLIKGLQRVGLAQPDVEIYFTAHYKLDPLHTAELLTGIKDQIPRFTLQEMIEFVKGAHIAVAAGKSQYRLVLEHLKHTNKS